MYNNQSYDDYIRSILGYPMPNNMCQSGMCSNNMYQNSMNQNDMCPEAYSMMNMQEEDDDLESMYPEIYRIIYPMVQKACDSNTRPITRENIDNMVNDIYLSIEADNMINVNINLQNENRSSTSQGTNGSSNATRELKSTSNELERKENRGEDRQENRQFRNRNLQDLIRILLIRELLRRRRRRPPFGRPPFGRPPMRPPFPGGGGRPPFNRGDFDSGMSQMQLSDYDIYERY